MPHPAMAPDELKRTICREIAVRFLESGLSTSRRELLVRYQDTEAIRELCDHSCIDGVGERPGDNTAYIPRLRAFVLCGDDALLQRVTSGMVLAVEILRRMFIEGTPDPQLSAAFEAILKRAREIDADFSDRTLHIGLMFSCWTGSVGSVCLTQDRTEVDRVYISDHIVNIRDSEQWVAQQVDQHRRVKLCRDNPMPEFSSTEYSDLSGAVGFGMPAQIHVLGASEALRYMHSDLQGYGHYFQEQKWAQAVVAAFTRVENRLNEIRDAAAPHNNAGASGVSLPHALFESGELRFPFPKLGVANPKARDAYEKSLRNFLACGIGWFRNSFSHEPHNLPALNEGECLEHLFIASYMLKLIDKCV